MYMTIIVKHLCNRMADQTKLHGRGTKVCINGQGNLPKMAAMAKKCKKTLKMFFFRTIGPMIFKVGMNYVQSLSMAQIMT